MRYLTRRQSQYSQSDTELLICCIKVETIEIMYKELIIRINTFIIESVADLDPTG